MTIIMINELHLNLFYIYKLLLWFIFVVCFQIKFISEKLIKYIRPIVMPMIKDNANYICSLTISNHPIFNLQ